MNKNFVSFGESTFWGEEEKQKNFLFHFTNVNFSIGNVMEEFEHAVNILKQFEKRSVMTSLTESRSFLNFVLCYKDQNENFIVLCSGRNSPYAIENILEETETVMAKKDETQ